MLNKQEQLHEELLALEEEQRYFWVYPDNELLETSQTFLVCTRLGLLKEDWLKWVQENPDLNWNLRREAEEAQYIANVAEQAEAKEAICKAEALIEAKNNKTLYEQLSEKRKESIALGLNPEWLTTPAYQMLVDKFFTKEDTNLKAVFTRISKIVAKAVPAVYVDWEKIFFDLMWSGQLCLSSPTYNLGTDRGLSVSCTGNYVEDSVDSFYGTLHESAMLTKEGFGTSSYLGDIRPRGASITAGGTASGVLPVVKQFVQMSRDISQSGSLRRGAHACYLELDHPDAPELLKYLQNNPEGLNIGWNITDNFIEQCVAGNPKYLELFEQALHVKLLTGKGYFLFVDKIRRAAPKEFPIEIKASNLCSEIALPSDKDHSFTCILASMNVSTCDSWDDDTVFNATVFTDALVTLALEELATLPALHKAHRFTEKSRAIGIGQTGFHTYLQELNIPMESLQAQYINKQIAQHIEKETRRASNWLATEFGEPLWMSGTGRRNITLQAIAPNTTSALLCGSVSSGIAPIYSNAYVQVVAGGEINRVNPTLIRYLKEAGRYNNEEIVDIITHDGSVQHLDWMSDTQKAVLKTAFELDQRVLLRLAGQRGQHIDQWQSLDLYFNHNTTEEEIAAIYKEAFLDPLIRGLYYLRSSNSNKASTGECVACSN